MRYARCPTSRRSIARWHGVPWRSRRASTVPMLPIARASPQFALCSKPDWCIVDAMRLVSAVLVVAGLVFAVPPAFAQDPNKVFAGQIITMIKRPPASAKSPDAYIATMRKMKVSNFYEDKTDHTWTVWMAAFLKSPLNDLEYSVK